MRAPRLVAALLLTTPVANAQTTVDRWLVLGPTPARAAFNAAAGDSAVMDATRLMLQRGWPTGGTAVSLPGGTVLRWQPGTGSATDGDVLHAAVFLSTDRWTRATLAFTGGDAATRRVWLDGQRVMGPDVELRTGKHLLLVQRLGRGAGSSEALSVKVTPSVAGATISPSLDPQHPGTWGEMHGVARVGSLVVDPTATRVAMFVRRHDAESDRYVTTLQVHEVASGRPVSDAAVPNAVQARWSADGKRLFVAAITDRQGAAGMDLWEWTPEGTSRRLLRAEPGLGLVGSSTDGEWLYFTATQRIGATPPPKPGEATRLTEVWDRWAWSADKAHLFAFHPGSGSRVTLVGDTAAGVSAATLSPDGRSIGFTRTVQDNSRRPWMRAEIWTIDVATKATRRVLELTNEAFQAPGALAWSPDSKALAFCASAKAIYQGNDPAFSVFENELYATSVERGGMVHLSEGFVPSVGGGLGCSTLVWNAADGRIYVPADEGAKTPPARTVTPVTSALAKTTLEVMRPLPGPVGTAFDIGGNTMVIATESPNAPSVVSRIDLRTGTTQPIVRPNTDALTNVAVPASRDWSFRNTRGEEIEAWYWVPPGFDSTRTYPMIVHYYGGTLPMKKDFEQRLLWFASNGYVVLYMNPAGTPGYGQTFSNYHINDWGVAAATDIIEGTEQFVKAHRWVDGSRIGNFGHSYGGFMTMLIHTRTKLFRTGIELAGISNIANYWGAGWTGFSYTDGTCPGCYPWNRKDVYVDRSPLFSADKITSPMLMIHGTDDTNVVPTESEQMFTALRMLGREAELIRVAGENHGINSKPSVEYLRDAIMLDWYDKYLKGQPEAWAARWGIKAPPKTLP